MDTVMKCLHDYVRQMALEKKIPELDGNLREKKASLRDAKLAAAQAQWERNKAEKGGFFQKLLGNQEEKRETAHRKYREAQAAERKETQSVQEAERALAAAKQEYEALAGSWGAFLAEKKRYLTEGGDKEALADAATPVLAEQAVREIGKCLENLEEALTWMRADVRTTRISPENRKLEFLGEARACANRTVQVLEQLPEGTVELPGYLRNPDGFILGVTMAHKQLDRVDLAQKQLREIRNRLRKM